MSELAVKPSTPHAVAMQTLRQIAAMKRKTREQQLAYATVTFLDALDSEAAARHGKAMCAEQP